MAANYIVLPGSRIGMKNGQLVESLGDSGLGIGSGIGMQAFVGQPPSNYDFQRPMGCTSGGDGAAQGLKAMLTLPVIFGVLAIAYILKT